MEIYILKWEPTGQVLEGSAAYTDRERAEKHADLANKNMKWWFRIYDRRWIVSTLNLKVKSRDAKKIR